MSEPLVWLPFPPDRLGEAPPGLRYEVMVPEEGAGPPESAEEVELFVQPYRFSRADNELIALLPRLRVVQTLTAGIEHVAPYLPDRVTLCNGRGIHDDSTAELALTLLLASLRGVPEFVRAQDRREWRPSWRPALADKRVMVLGYGQIGAAVEARLLPFGVEVVRVASSARPGVHAVGELPLLLTAVDVVVVVVPATPETAGMVDAEFLASMKDGALLVNVARGSVVDTEALADALETGRLSAALDVTDPEPLPPDHRLWRAPNLLVSPHVGGASSAMWPRAYRLVRDQLARYAAGEPLVNVVLGPPR
ncbi:MAG TPA: 2-hydroxyacid dehydrogenase [Nocardioides sp.]|uniref:2-hydroxyacid dehydrogenase n=1 Tax=Nocardioides sp. TaxID=35761 RepID=UPI002B8933C2|nr:2-hydroxyacid dehydrogenase [Nocardioides sp.]HQR25578.1 2-hydroxyacid dehydrogenase [Nocardioides sp.]